MGPKCYDVQCIVNGEETPQIALPLDFIILPEKDLAVAIGNMHKKFGKDRACGSVDILADRQTHTQTHTNVLITILCNRSAGEVLLFSTSGAESQIV